MSKFNPVFLPLLYCFLLFSTLIACLTLNETTFTKPKLLFFFQEGGPIETLSFIFLFCSSLLLFYSITFKKHLFTKRSLPLLIAALFLLAAFDRSDWGQRYLNYPTPEWFKHHNQDNQLNIHDIVWLGFSWHQWFLIGMMLFSYIYFVFLPLIGQTFPKIQQKMGAIGLPVVPLSFTVPVFLSLIVAFFISTQFPNAWFDPHKIPELVASAALFFSLVQEYQIKPC